MITDEAITLMGAGEVIMHGILALIILELLQQPDTWNKLREEILIIFPDITKPPSLTQLERLPFLTSIIIEGMQAT
jgi:cytochrome P450